MTFSLFKITYLYCGSLSINQVVFHLVVGDRHFTRETLIKIAKESFLGDLLRGCSCISIKNGVGLPSKKKKDGVGPIYGINFTTL